MLAVTDTGGTEQLLSSATVRLCTGRQLFLLACVIYYTR